MSGADLELEESLRGLAPAFKDGIDPPATLHVAVMSRTAAPRSPARRSMLRELSLAAALIAFVALLAFGFSRLHALSPTPAKPHPTPNVIPWTPAAMVLPSASAQLASPAEAATWIGHITVAKLDPVLLPSAIGDDYQAEFLADLNGFAVDYASFSRHATVKLASSQPMMPAPGSHSTRTTRPFRGVTATYQIDGVAASISRWLFWSEKGTSHDIAYSLIADGLSESDFWLVANSLQPLTPLTSVRPCVAADLHAAAGRGGAATGGLIFNIILLSNHSDTSCVLEGTPQVLLKTSSGHTLSLTQASMAEAWLPSPLLPALMSAHSSDPQLQNGIVAGFGHASLLFSMVDCPANPGLSVVTMILPYGRGTISLPANDIALSGGGQCEGGNILQRIEVSPFAGTEPSPVWVDNSPLSVTVKLPDHVRAGQSLHYQVILTNLSGAPFHFHDCPSYTEDASRRGSKNLANYQLNCASVGWLDPGASATFEMVLDIPAGILPGPGNLRWSMRSAYGNGEAEGPLTITAP